jgi:RNA polymerase sigma factor (sigma-70 family)
MQDLKIMQGYLNLCKVLEIPNRISFDWIRKVVGVLPPKEKEIILARYGLDDGKPLTLDEVGQRWNVTRERIRQQEKRGLGRLKGFLT